MMKTTLLFFALLLSVSSVYAQKYKIFKHKKKWGLEKIDGANRTEIISPTYDNVSNRNSYYLFYNKSKEMQINALMVSNKGEKMEKFKEIVKSSNDFIIHKNEQGMHAYSVSDKKNVFINANSIRIKKIQVKGSYRTYFITVKNGDVSVILNEKVILQEPNKDVFIDSYNDLIKVGNGLFNLYDLEGKIIAENVTNYGRVSNYYRSELYMQYGKDSISIIKDGATIIEKMQGKIDPKLQSNNRIIIQSLQGFSIYNFKGEKLSKVFYEALFNPYFSTKNKGLPNFVKYNSKWFMVDDTYTKINSEEFETVEVFNDDFSRSNWIYKVKRKSDAPHFEYLDTYGKSFLNEPLEVISQQNENTSFLIVKKDNKFGFINSYGRSEIIYDQIKVTELEYSQYQKSYACKKGKYEVIYIPGKVHKEFFNEGQYDKIESLKFYEEEESSFYWFLHKNNQFQIATPNDLNETSSFSILSNDVFDSYEMSDFDFDYNYPLLLTSNGKTGLFEGYTLDTIVPMEYTKIVLDYDLMDLYSATEVRKGDKVGLYDVGRKKIKLPVVFDSYSLLDDILSVETNGKYGAWDIYKNELFIDTIFTNPITYDQVDDFTIRNAKAAKVNGEDKFCYQVKGQMYCFDEIIEDPYLEFYIVKNKAKKGVINHNGVDTLIPIEYDLVEKYPLDMDGLALTKNKKHSLYLIGTGKLSYTNADEVVYCRELGQDFVRKGNRWAIYEFGQEQRPFEFEAISYNAPFYNFKKDGKWGGLNVDFEEIIPAIYETEKDLKKHIKKM